MRILIIDDNDDSAESLAVLLRLDGHEASTLSEGSEAVQIVEALRPDMIVLDIGLPGIDGFEVARRLRSAGCTARLVAFTGYGAPEDRARAKAAGFDDHLLKPVDPMSLAYLFT